MVVRRPVNKKTTEANENTYYCVVQVSEKCKRKNGLLTANDFYTASNQGLFKNGKIHICKDCMKEYVYTEDGELNLDRFKKVLMMIDYPFYQIEFESAVVDKKDTIGVYFKNIYLNHKGAAWSNGDPSYDKKIINNEIFENEDFCVTQDIIKFWGKNYTKEEYLFLQEYYHELIRMYDHSLPVQVNNYRNMAKTQLQANKCLENGDMGGYDKAIKILSMLSGDSNIKPVQENSTEKITKGGFDVFIKHIEEDEPILDWEKDLGHVDKIKHYLNIFFFGNLAKALGIKNPWQEEFDNEMAEYTVELSEAEEDTNSQVDFLGEK